MGWWETYDGAVIGDELADIVGDGLDVIVGKLLDRYPKITREQVLHSLAFCSGCFKKLGDIGRKWNDDTDKILQVMTIKQRDEWTAKHRVPPDMAKRVAPNTTLMNVHNPFTGDIV